MEAQENKKKVIYGILEYLSEEFNNPGTSADNKESLEVAMQCLETAFGITVRDQQYKGTRSLREMYESERDTRAQGDSAQVRGPPGQGLNLPHVENVIPIDVGPDYVPPSEATETQKAEAEEFKNKGNDSMRNSNFSDALNHYNRAVELDGRNAVYFCNRAAAYMKLEQLEEALRDCQIAVQLQPQYARAYGRMGVAYSSRNQHIEAIMCYRKALSIEPENDSYITNLRYSQRMLGEEATATMAQEPSGTGFAGGFENLIRNPNLINMASQMLQDPSMNQLIQNLMGGLTGGSPPPPAQGAPGAGGPGGQPQGGNPLESLMQVGEAIANTLRANNPDLASQLGVPGRPRNGPNSQNDGDNNDPSPPST